MKMENMINSPIDGTISKILISEGDSVQHGQELIIFKEIILEDLILGIETVFDNPRLIIMWIISFSLLYFGIFKKKEPLLLVPISMGLFFANLPLSEFVRLEKEGHPAGLLITFQKIGMESDIFPLLIFLGVGASTDFGPMLRNPKTLLLGAGAQMGVFISLLGALFLGYFKIFDFGLLEASSIGIIGGADGPTTIFISTRMRELGESLSGVELWILLSYSNSCLFIYGFSANYSTSFDKAFTTKKEREIKMNQVVQDTPYYVKIIFPILSILIISILVPSASTLIGMLMLGNLIKVSGVVPRLADVSENSLMNVTIIFLGLAVGSTMPAEVFLSGKL